MRMKRFTTLMLVICLFASLMTLASCEIKSVHKHELTEVTEVAATCTEAGTKAYYKCSSCEKLFADKDGAKEITAPEAIAALDHSFTNYISNNDATCEADGTETAKCDRCEENDTKTVANSKLGHNYGTDLVFDTNGHWYVCANGCNVKGSEEAHTPNIENATETDAKICTECEYVIEAALGHKTHDYNVPKYDATHHWNQCYGCNEISEKIEHEYSESIINDSTCTATGTKKLTCDCGYSKEETIPVKEHSFTVKTVSEDTKKSAADCKNAAVYYFSCSCGEKSATETFEDGIALGHDYTEAIEDAAHLKEKAANCQSVDTYWYDCSRCEASAKDDAAAADKFFNSTIKGDHVWADNYTTADGNHYKACQYGCEGAQTANGACSDVDTDTDHKCDVCQATVGDHSYGAWEKDDDANHKKTCNCGDVVTETHSFTNYVSNNDATCTQDGTETAQCGSCTATDTRTDENSTLPHSPAKAIKENDIPATCAEDGSYELVVYCSVESCKYQISREKITVKATGAHVYANEKEKIESTCTTAGYVIMACGCGATQKTDLPLGDHNIVIEEAVEPTCTQTGLTKGEYCTNCDYKIAQEEIEEKGHTAGEWVTTLPATCEAAGERVAQCVVCSAIAKHEAIDALGHEYEGVVTDPTCTAEGYTTYICKHDSKHTYVGDRKESLGHTESAAVKEKEVAPDCENAGSYESVVYCSVCKAEVSRNTVSVDALGHDYAGTVTAPTCEAQGYTTYVCKNNSAHTYVDDYVDALAHTVTTHATCQKAGICDNCKNEIEAKLNCEDKNDDGYCDNGCNLPIRFYIATIRSSSNYFYMTTDLGTASTKRYQAVNSGLTELPSQIKYPEVQYVFVLIGNGDGTYSIQAEYVDGDNYLGWTSGNSGALVAEVSAVKFTIDKKDDGTYNIHFAASDAERYLALNVNSGSDYFAWYKSGQKQDLILIPVTGEPCNHENTTTDKKDATCTEAGYNKVTCECGHVVSDVVIPATGEHSYVDGTCTGCGAAEVAPEPEHVCESICSNCGKCTDTECTYDVCKNNQCEGHAATPVWTLVTDVKTLQIGDQIVIVAKDYNYAISTTQNNNNRGQASVSKDGSTITFGADVQILTLKAGAVSGSFAFYTDSGYLYAASSSSNYLKTETKLSNNSSWSITISDSVATIIAQGTNTRNTMQYNQSSSLFACYASASQKALVIYKLVGGSGETPETPSCEHTNTTTTTVDATCTEAGSTTVTCDDCGETVSTKTIDALGHTTENGICERCNMVIGGTSDPETPVEKMPTTKYSFSSYSAGTQYAQGEEHKLDENTKLTINGAHLNTQIRLYAGSNCEFEFSKTVEKIEVTAGNKAGTLTVYVSEDGKTWSPIETISTTTNYVTYTVDLGGSYQYVKLDSTGAQIRVPILTVNP